MLRPQRLLMGFLTFVMAAALLVTPAAAIQVAPENGPGQIRDQLGTSTRVLGMGGAFVGLADDQSALWYNPAGLGHLRGRAALMADHTLTETGETQSTLALAGTSAGIGVSLARLPAAGADGAFEEADAALGFGIHLANLGIGVTGHYVDQKATGSWEAKGLTGDAGALLVVGPLRVGAVWRNAFGSYTRTSTPGGQVEVDDLGPFRQTIYGAALRFRIVNVAVDYVVPPREGDLPVVRGGAEVWLGPLGLRAGVSGQKPNGDDLLVQSRTIGATLGLGRLRLDYARRTIVEDGAGAGDAVQSFALHIEI